MSSLTQRVINGDCANEACMESDDIEANIDGTSSPENMIIYYTCGSCGAAWSANYKIDGIKMIKEGGEERMIDENETWKMTPTEERGGCDDPVVYDDVFQKLHSNGFKRKKEEDDSVPENEVWYRYDGDYRETVEVRKGTRQIFCSVFGVFQSYEEQNGIDFEEFITRC